MANCFTLLLILAVVLTAVFYLAAPSLLVLFGASANTLPFALDYARIYVLGSVFVLIVLGMNPFVTTQGFAAFSMLTTVIGAVCNIILDPIFIFVLNIGVKGAATATIISQAVGALWVLKFLTGKRTKLKLRAKDMPLQRRIILPCLALGVSTFVMIATESILSISFNSSLARYGGDLAVGAMTIITSVSQLLSMPLQGICQGGQPLMSFNFGAGKTDRVKQAFRLQFGFCVALAACSGSSACWPRRFWRASSPLIRSLSATRLGLCAFIWRASSPAAFRSPASKALWHWGRLKSACLWPACAS